MAGLILGKEWKIEVLSGSLDGFDHLPKEVYAEVNIVGHLPTVLHWSIWLAMHSDSKISQFLSLEMKEYHFNFYNVTLDIHCIENIHRPIIDYPITRLIWLQSFSNRFRTIFKIIFKREDCQMIFSLLECLHTISIECKWFEENLTIVPKLCSDGNKWL